MASPRSSINLQEIRTSTSTSEETLLSKKEKRKTPHFEPQSFILSSKIKSRDSHTVFDDYFVRVMDPATVIITEVVFVVAWSS